MTERRVADHRAVFASCEYSNMTHVIRVTQKIAYTVSGKQESGTHTFAIAQVVTRGSFNTPVVEHGGGH